MFTERVLDHVARLRNLGPIEGASLGESGVEGDGPYIKIWVQVENGIVRRAAYKTYGCPASIACSSQLVEIILGRSVEMANEIAANDLIVLLAGLPDGKSHCAAMAIEAMREAIENNRVDFRKL